MSEDKPLCQDCKERPIRALGRCARCYARFRYGAAPRTHCKHGHELNEDNILVRANGSKICRTCQRERECASQRRRRAEIPKKPQIPHETRVAAGRKGAEKRWQKETEADGGWLTINEAAEIKGIHRDSICAAMNRGALPFSFVQGRRMILRGDMGEYVPRNYPRETDTSPSAKG